jgi:UDPglucose 6-dehydrogenase
MNDYLVTVTKSTVPVGTAPKVKEAIQFELNKRNLNIDFDVASNPEFLKEGDAINDFMKPDRIVIGVESDRAKEIFQRLYKPFTLNGHPIIFMDIPSAEMTKYAANAMLAPRISFGNDIANLCEILGADVNMVRLGIGSDPRIGSKFLYPGIGYGGSCFPKDVKALIKAGEENNYPLRLLQAVENIKEDHKSILVDKLLKFYNGDISGKKIALWGISFKPNTDDMREAPSLVIIDKLLNNNAQVIAYDPASMEETKRRIGDIINYADDMYDAVKDADALILVTEWTEFRLPDWEIIKKLMKSLLILDGRNIYDANEMKEMGFYYYCIGGKTN